MKKKQKVWWILVLLLTGLDQLFKWLIRMYLPFQKEVWIIPSFFSLRFVKNQGAAWSLFENVPFFLLLFSLFVICFLLYYSFKKKPPFQEQFAIFLILGGALGNLLDRIFYKEVIDYLSFTFGNYAFPVFNFADICVVVGVFLWIFLGGRRDTDGMDCNV